jgi:hypothetical protein
VNTKHSMVSQNNIDGSQNVILRVIQVSADSFKERKQKRQKLHTELQETIYGAKEGPEYPIQYESE